MIRTGAYMAIPMMKRKNNEIEMPVYESAILDSILATTGLSIVQLRSKQKTRSMADARANYFFLMKNKFPNLTLDLLGHKLNRDHATVLYAIRKHKMLVNSDPLYRNLFEDINDKLNAKLG